MSNNSTIRREYESLWDKGFGAKYKVTKVLKPYESEEVSFEKLAHFVPMKGEKYDSSEIRLMLIGRAVNGWFDADVNTKSEYGNYIEQLLINDNGKFDWIIEENGVLYNKNDLGSKGDYRLSSPFWDYSKSIFKILINDKKPDKYQEILSDARWVDYIVWTNLYKIAPTYMDNPDKEMIKLQQAECINILKYEIERYKPTHILAFTGWNDWFCNFAELMSECNFIGTNVMRGKNKNSIYLEAVGKIGDAKVIVTCRPENRNKEQFLNDVCKEI